MKSSRRRALSYEQLEDRTLLSADLSGGVLTVLGTKDADVIEVERQGISLEVTVNDETTSFNLADVNELHIEALKGDDWVKVHDDVAVDAWIDAGKGDDTVYGGAGDDEIHGGKGKDLLYGGDGDDELYGEKSKDELHGDAGNDTLDGGKSKDVLHGGVGNDSLHGGKSKDVLYGDDGDDRLYGDKSKDTLYGGLGDDELHGDKGKDELYGDWGDDVLVGGKGKDALFGGQDDDVLRGGKSKDLLDGGEGNNLLEGGKGKNSMVNGLAVQLGTELWGDLTGESGATGHAEYEIEHEHGGWEVEFELEVEGAVPGSVHDVYVDGVLVGQITIDEEGEGELEFSSGHHGDDEAFPANFPELQPGTTIVVGSILSGQLSEKIETKLYADLSGTTAVSGIAEFEFEQEGATEKTEFEVEVENAVPGSTLDVFIDGVLIGQIPVDGDGDGKLKLSSDPDDDEDPLPGGFPAVSEGSVVTVGSILSGTLTPDEDSDD